MAMQSRYRLRIKIIGHGGNVAACRRKCQSNCATEKFGQDSRPAAALPLGSVRIEPSTVEARAALGTASPR
jgi:hypothetical protein